MLIQVSKPKGKLTRTDEKPMIGDGWITVGYEHESGEYYEHVTTEAGRDVWYQLVDDED